MLLRDTHLVVDLDQLATNVQEIHNHIGKDIGLCAVIKANGYGMGAVDIAPTLLENGAALLAVANLLEAMELRKADPDWPILVMGHTPDEYLHVAVDNNIVLTVFTLDQALLINTLAKKPHPIHIKLDTGFGRLGFETNAASAEAILKIFTLDRLQVDGVFSHLALASREEDEVQLGLLLDLKKRIETEFPGRVRWYHICDSISAIAYPDFRLDMARIGAALYGAKSYRYPDFPIKPIATFKTRISRLKTIEPGEGVSYDYAWKASRKSIIATMPFGYADGYPRSMTGKGTVLIGGIDCPIVGIICMDQCMADVTDVPGVHEGQEVIIYHDNWDDLSRKAGTNKNEILSRLMPRVPRIYLKNGKTHHIRNDLL
jgi:alanine racemase